LGYVAQVGNSLLAFRNKLLALHSRAKRSKSFILECWPLMTGATGCLETSVTTYQPTLRKIAEERRPQLHREGGLKSRIPKQIALITF
jgi:hypothetical protein